MNEETKPTKRVTVTEGIGYSLIVTVIILGLIRLGLDFMSPHTETQLALDSLNGNVDVKTVDMFRRIKEGVSIALYSGMGLAGGWWVAELLVKWIRKDAQKGAK